MKLGRTTFLHFLTLVVVSAAGFISRFAIGILEGESVLGQYSIAVAIGFYWLVVPGSAIALATSKRISEGDQQAEFLTAGFLVNGTLALLLAAVIIAIGTAIDTFFPDSTVPFLAVVSGSKELIATLAVTTILFRTSIQALKGQKKVALSGTIKAIERVLRTGSQVVFLFLNFALAGLVFGHATSLLIAALLSVIVMNISFSRPSWRHVKDILAFGQYSWASTLQNRVFGWLDVLVLSFFVSDGLIGIYEAAWGFGSLLVILNTSIKATLFPEISDLSTDERFDEIRHFLGEGIVFAGLFVIPGLFGAAVVGERLLEIYRPSFGKGDTILVILIFSYVGDIYGTQFVNALNAIDRPDVTYRVNVGFMISNFVLNVLLIWQFGWYGAAVATAISAWLRLVFSYVPLERHLGRPEIPLSAIGWQIVSSAVMAVSVAFVNPLVPGGRLYTVLLVAFGAVIYIGLVVTLSPLIRQKGINVVRDMQSIF